MIIVIDKRMPLEAKKALETFGEIIEFATSGITYEAISGHPDIFFCLTPVGLIVAPNTPVEYTSLLKARNISFNEGKLPVGSTYPKSARYNAVFTENHLIHNHFITDPALKALGVCKDSSSVAPSLLFLNQGYTRCNLLAIDIGCFITSDKGIERALQQKGMEVHYVSPEGIVLPGFEHGFIGGCCGINEGRLFISGNLSFYRDGEKVREVARLTNLEIIELYSGPLFDGGGIFFIQK